MAKEPTVFNFGEDTQLREAPDGRLYIEDRDGNPKTIDSLSTEEAGIKNRAEYTSGWQIDDQYSTWGRQLDYWALMPDRANTGIVSLCLDDTQQEDHSMAFPRLRNRGIPFGLATITGSIGGSQNTTEAEINEMLEMGAEILNHTNGSKNFDTISEEELVEEVIEARRTLEEDYNWPVKSLVPPGNKGISPDDVGTFKERIIRSTHLTSRGGGIANGDSYTGRAPMLHGFQPVNLDTLTESEAKAQVDAAADTQSYVCFIAHPAKIDNGEVTMTTADFTAFLDYLKQERSSESGSKNIEIATPTTARVVPFDPDDVNFAPVSSPPNDTWSGYWDVTGNQPTVQTDGGHTGSNYWTIGGSTGGSSSGGLQLSRAKLPPWCSHYMVRCWARNPNGDGGSLRIGDAANTEEYTLGGATFEDTDWHEFHAPIGLYREQTIAEPRIRTSESELDVDDVAIYPC